MGGYWAGGRAADAVTASAAAALVAPAEPLLALCGFRAQLSALSTLLPLPLPHAHTLLLPQALLPFYGMAYAATVVSALAQVAATKMKGQFNTLCCE
jgi:hypothetical protein